MTSPDGAPLTIRLLGPIDVRIRGAPLPPLRSRKGLWLLALLVLRHDRDVDRSWLAGTLWPDSTESQAYDSLSQSLSDLRRALDRPCAGAGCRAPHDGPDVDADAGALSNPASRIHSPSRRTLRLDLTDADVDILTFDLAIGRQDVASLRQAVSLYRGPLLEGCMEEWVFQERETRETAYLHGLEALAAHAQGQGELTAAVGYLRQVVGTDPLRESSHRLLMDALARAGSYAEAGQVYRELRRGLRQELQAEPAPETTRLFEQIRMQARDHAHTSTPLPPSPQRPAPDNDRLPYALTALIGREQDAQEVQNRLASTRLVTLTGAGGVGKTRLAIEVARRLCPDYPDGTAFVELAPLSDPALTPQAVASALEITEAPDRPLIQTLREALRPRWLLLVLDNCEHLLDACAELADSLLKACPRLRILATSRQSLGLMGEMGYRVPSLSLPERSVQACDGSGLLAAAEGSAAVRLFVERATAAQPGFRLTTDNAAAVLQICRWLDGIPLAIELAAVRVRALPLQEVAGSLDELCRLLTVGSRTASHRQQTLRATMDWSHDLLSDEERVLLRRLSGFRGGWTLKAAQRVCSGDGLDERDVMDRLTSLVDQSLVVLEGDRYRLLEPVRQYALEKLLESGGGEALRDRHLEHFLAFAEEAEERCKGPEQPQWLDRLEAEHDNFRAALEWAGRGGAAAGNRAAPDGGEGFLRLSTALCHFWDMRGYCREALDWLERALAGRESPACPPLVEARALESTALLLTGGCQTSGWQERCIAALEKATALFREAGDTAGLARCLALRSQDKLCGPNPEPSLALARESVRLARTQKDPFTLACVLWVAPWIEAQYGDREEGIRLTEEGLQVFRNLGQPGGVARGACHLSWHFEGNDLARTCSLAEEALRNAKQVRSPGIQEACLARLAHNASRAGDEQRMIERLEEGLAVRPTAGFGVHPYLAVWLASALLRRDSPERARGLLERVAGQEHSPLRYSAPACWLLGGLARRDGDAEAGRRYEEQALRLAREGDEAEQVIVLGGLGHAAQDLGETKRARAFYDGSLALARELGNGPEIARRLEELGVLASMEGRHQRAARLIGATEAQAETLGLTLPVSLMPDGFHRAVALTREALGEEAFAAAWAEGRAMTLEQALQLAMGTVEAEGRSDPG